MKNQFPRHILCTEIILGPTELLPVSSQSKQRQDRLVVQWTNFYKIYSKDGNVVVNNAPSNNFVPGHRRN